MAGTHQKPSRNQGERSPAGGMTTMIASRRSSAIHCCAPGQSGMTDTCVRPRLTL